MRSTNDQIKLFEGQVTCHLIEIEFQGISIVLSSEAEISYTLMYSKSDEPIKYDQRLELSKKISRGIHANENYTEKIFLIVYKDKPKTPGRPHARGVIARQPTGPAHGLSAEGSVG